MIDESLPSSIYANGCRLVVRDVIDHAGPSSRVFEPLFGLDLTTCSNQCSVLTSWQNITSPHVLYSALRL